MPDNTKSTGSFWEMLLSNRPWESKCWISLNGSPICRRQRPPPVAPDACPTLFSTACRLTGAKQQNYGGGGHALQYCKLRVNTVCDHVKKLAARSKHALGFQETPLRKQPQEPLAHPNGRSKSTRNDLELPSNSCSDWTSGTNHPQIMSTSDKRGGERRMTRMRSSGYTMKTDSKRQRPRAHLCQANEP